MYYTSKAFLSEHILQQLASCHQYYSIAISSHSHLPFLGVWFHKVEMYSPVTIIPTVKVQDNPSFVLPRGSQVSPEHYLPEAIHQFTELTMPPVPELWNQRCEPPHLVYVGIKPGALLHKRSTNISSQNIYSLWNWLSCLDKWI